MRTIGITGGVGAGKSYLLDYIKENYNVIIWKADEVANKLQGKNMPCYELIIKLLGNEVLNQDLTINKVKMADIIFHKPLLLSQVNAIVHPAVKSYVLSQIDIASKANICDFFILEAALLLEEHYDEILDEIWYIYADEATRTLRLKNARNYSDDKINAIMNKQLSHKEFQNKCKITIENTGDSAFLYEQVDRILGGYLHE